MLPELWQSDTVRSHFTNKCSLDNSSLLYLTCLHATLAMYVIDNVYFTLELATFRKNGWGHSRQNEIVVEELRQRNLQSIRQFFTCMPPLTPVLVEQMAVINI